MIDSINKKETCHVIFDVLRRYTFKRERLKALMVKAKEKLETLWKELYFSNEQKEAFYKKSKSNDEYSDEYPQVISSCFI